MVNIFRSISTLSVPIPKLFWPENIRKAALEKSISDEADPSWFWIVILLVTGISICAWAFYYKNNLTLSYNDARSHLNVARRVVDSLQPGLAQIGSVWLPLQHLLQLFTIWNDFMYRTGLSGSLISMISFAGSNIFIWKIIKQFNLGNLAALTGVAVFSSNANILFLQTTPMTESLMLVTSLGAVFFFTKWVKYDQISSLILSGIFTLLAVLTRYDGWLLFAFLSFSTFAVSLMKHGRVKAEGHFILYSSLGLFGIALWIGWNAIIFGDPLFFVSGPFSAKAQQEILAARGLLPTKGNLALSIYTYFLTIKENVGEVIFILGILGFIKALFSKFNFTYKMAFLGLFVPVVFNIISLYFGQSAIHLPQLPPHTWFNVRYGIMSLPAIAICIAFLVNRREFVASILIMIALLQAALMYSDNNVITIQDSVRGSSGFFLDDTGAWLNENASQGLILTAASSNDALIFKSGLPLKHFITEGMAKYWNEALIHPARHADYIIMHEGDLVYNNLVGTSEFTENYKLVYLGNFASVYKKKTD